ncbi:unnamed protein product [Closterium sp. NIES-64]|nr:unnamed protein product [Closterium sp. NIES-65]CAI5947222.1 unnamed protein product [Closterium sp. NIES-65]CAI5954061.1 unnamed protein product [Closterium sp. NIES-65]CAI6005326.1 unnamed protein product [Closterium sp. NIES-64]
MPASRLLAPRAPSALADLTAVMRIHDAPAAAAASYLSPGSVVPFPYGFGGGIGERGVSSSSRCGCHQQRSCRARRHARLLAARTRKVVIARAAIRSASPPPSSPSASAGRVHATVAAGAAATVEAQSAASAALPTVAIPTVLPRGIEKDKEVVLLAESAAKGEDGAASRGVVASAVGERAESAGRTPPPPHPRALLAPLFPPLSPSFSPPVQRDGSVILRFAPLPDPLAPTAHALSPAPAAPRAERDSIGAPRGGGETPPGGGAAEVRADAGVVAFVTACTSEFSREVPDALIEEIVGLPLRLTPVDHMAKWVAISAHHTVAAINQVIDLPASALHHGSLPSLLHVLGLSKPLLPSAPSSSPSSAPPVVAPTAPFQGGRPTPPPPVPVSAAAALPAQHAPPSAAASIAVTTITGVVLAGLVQFLASFAGLVGRVPGGSSGVGQSRLLWNLPAATVLLLVAAVKVWAAWWHQHHRQQVGAAV